MIRLNLSPCLLDNSKQHTHMWLTHRRMHVTCLAIIRQAHTVVYSTLMRLALLPLMRLALLPLMQLALLPLMRLALLPFDVASIAVFDAVSLVV